MILSFETDLQDLYPTRGGDVETERIDAGLLFFCWAIQRDHERSLPVVGRFHASIEVARRFYPIHLEAPVTRGQDRLDFDRNRLGLGSLKRRVVPVKVADECLCVRAAGYVRINAV